MNSLPREQATAAGLPEDWTAELSNSCRLKLRDGTERVVSIHDDACVGLNLSKLYQACSLAGGYIGRATAQ